MREQIDDYIQRSLVTYGKEINTNRQLAFDLDGLKPVYRRVIFTAMKVASKLTKTASISGQTIATVHPHSSDAVDSVISALVRWGIFTGQGNHGLKMIYGDDIQPSASRYTEAMVNPEWYKIFSELLPYVPYKEAELEGNNEPVYLPTPIPMILLFSGLGISFGCNARYPFFTPKSMLDALTKDDPRLLRAPFGLELDLFESELDELWNTGLGRLTYRYKVEKCGIASGYGTMISGSPEIFKPNLEKAFEEELAKGQIYILDQTSGDIPQVFVGRSPNVRAITDDDIFSVCTQVCKYTRMFRLTVTDGDSAHLIPLKSWLTLTMGNYLELIEKYKSDKINKLNFDYQVYTWLPIITECLINNRDYDAEQLAKVNKCDIEVVKAIMRKSISTLRNTDSTAKLKGIQDQIKQFKNLDAYKYTVELINSLW